MTLSLFGNELPDDGSKNPRRKPTAPPPPPTPMPRGTIVAVALENSLDKTLTYGVPPALSPEVAIGQRVKVPLGRSNRPAFGYIVELPPATDVPPHKLKRLLAIEDHRVILTPALMELARWMSRYYICPLGTVLESVIPSAVKKKIGLGYLTIAKPVHSPEELQKLVESARTPKRRALLARLLQLPPGGTISLETLASEAGVKTPTARKLAALGIVTLTTLPDLSSLQIADSTPTHTDIQLNPDQQLALDHILAHAQSGFSTSLLMGVTGSGKTEVYLQAVRHIISTGKQAIILVPEIALTPQTVRRFTERFPRVALLHSGLTQSQRHRQWQTILSGRADVVVGARSAVFAPVPKLGLIVVDEEHDGSYKQDQAPRYNGRDVAIKRAQIEGCLCLLGSATPSLESYLRAGASSGKPPHLLKLPGRVRGIQMPAVELVDMKQEARIRRSIHLLSTRLEHLLRTTIDKGEQAILLLNRRGYSSFVFCPSCQEALQCKFCDATLTYHRNPDAHAAGGSVKSSLHTGQLHCHYCLAVNTLPGKCPTCGKLLSLFGLGTQRVEEELTKRFPDLKFARVDSDTMRSSKDYEELLERFGKGEIQVLLGTQMIAKGLDFPSVTLVGVISGDTALALPDFRAAERTFQMITQVAGRAGRGDKPGRVVVQTYMPDDPTIHAALKQNFAGFAETELAQRSEVGLPPYARLARIILRDEDETKVQTSAADLANGLAAFLPNFPEVRLKGPMPCAINRIAGYHRVNILLSAPTPQPIQRILALAREQGIFKNLDRVAVDIDPVSLL